MGGSFQPRATMQERVPKVDTCRAQSTCELITPRPATRIDKGYTESGIFWNILHSKKQPRSSKQMQHHLRASRQTPKRYIVPGGAGTVASGSMTRVVRANSKLWSKYHGYTQITAGRLIISEAHIMDLIKLTRSTWRLVEWLNHSIYIGIESSPDHSVTCWSPQIEKHILECENIRCKARLTCVYSSLPSFCTVTISMLVTSQCLQMIAPFSLKKKTTQGYQWPGSRHKVARWWQLPRFVPAPWGMNYCNYVGHEKYCKLLRSNLTTVIGPAEKSWIPLKLLVSDFTNYLGLFENLANNSELPRLMNRHHVAPVQWL